MKCFGLTDKGRVRKDNQDSFIIEKCEAKNCLIVGLCDGMGGAKAGGLASQLSNKAFVDFVYGGVIKNSGKAHIINVGDSRAYHISRKSSSIYQITRDHSLVEELVEFGAITKEQAKTHPQRNVITRALGSEAKVESDYFELSMRLGDCILFCSDGLSNTLSDQELLEYAMRFPEPELLCRELMDEALSRGARDNVTVVAVMK